MKRIYKVNDKEWIVEEVQEVHSTLGNIITGALSIGAVLYTIFVLF
jgi:hypothetical protein